MGDLSQALKSHQDHDRADGGQRFPVRLIVLIGRTTGYHGEPGRDLTMGQRNSHAARNGDRACDAWYDLAADAGGRESQTLLAASSEDERIAALESNDDSAASRVLDQKPVDILLPVAVALGRFAREYPGGIRPNVVEQVGVYKAIVHYRVGQAQQLQPLSGDELRIAGTRPHEVDDGGFRPAGHRFRAL